MQMGSDTPERVKVAETINMQTVIGFCAGVSLGGASWEEEVNDFIQCDSLAPTSTAGSLSSALRH